MCAYVPAFTLLSCGVDRDLIRHYVIRLTRHQKRGLCDCLPHPFVVRQSNCRTWFFSHRATVEELYLQAEHYRRFDFKRVDCSRVPDEMLVVASFVKRIFVVIQGEIGIDALILSRIVILPRFAAGVQEVIRHT